MDQIFIMCMYDGRSAIERLSIQISDRGLPPFPRIFVCIRSHFYRPVQVLSFISIS